MHLVDAQREKMFRRFCDKGANEMHTLQDLLEQERSQLFDYLLRMTGQVSRSSETVDEVFQALSMETLETLATYSDLKVCLYTTARKFNADIWAANTAKLINAALEAPIATGGKVSTKLRLEEKERQSLTLLDKGLRGLLASEREAVLLWARAGFDYDEMAEITGLGAHDAELHTVLGLEKLVGGAAANASAVAQALKQLPDHPLPPRSAQATMNLSMVMADIKTKPAGLRSPWRIAFAVILAGGAVLWLVAPKIFSQVTQSVESWVKASLPAVKSERPVRGDGEGRVEKKDKNAKLDKPDTESKSGDEGSEGK